MHTRKMNPRQEYRLKLQALIEASPVMSSKFPKLKTLKVLLAYYDAAGTTKNGEMKCTLNVGHARSVLWFACPSVDCMGGDFDLSEALGKAVAGRQKVAAGELQCQGMRKRGDRERIPCHAVLRYKLSLGYG